MKVAVSKTTDRSLLAPDRMIKFLDKCENNIDTIDINEVGEKDCDTGSYRVCAAYTLEPSGLIIARLSHASSVPDADAVLFASKTAAGLLTRNSVLGSWQKTLNNFFGGGGLGIPDLSHTKKLEIPDSLKSLSGLAINNTAQNT